MGHKLGDIAFCAACSKQIHFNGEHWIHSDGKVYRHMIVPVRKVQSYQTTSGIKYRINQEGGIFIKTREKLSPEDWEEIGEQWERLNKKGDTVAM